MSTTDYPRHQNETTIWECCQSQIGPTCEHRQARRPQWRKSLVGITRESVTGASVTIKPAWDGGTRVIISRPVVWGHDIYTGEPTYIWQVTHSRVFR